MVLALFLLDEQQFHSSERERELPEGLPPTCERVKGFGDKGGNAREKLEVFLLVPPPFPKPQQWHESEDCAAETCPDSDRTPESESCTPGCSALPHCEQIHPESSSFRMLSCAISSPHPKFLCICPFLVCLPVHPLSTHPPIVCSFSYSPFGNLC